MKSEFSFPALTLFLVATALLLWALMFTPEPWQDTPWSLWDHCVLWSLAVLHWPLFVSTLILAQLPCRIPNTIFLMLCILLFVCSGIFWVSLAQAAWHRIRSKRA